jgi:catalase
MKDTFAELYALDDPLISGLLDAPDALSGSGPRSGFRPAHAKGVMCSGTFTPDAAAVQLTRAPHAQRPSTRVVVRFSDSSGLPAVADNDAQRASPRGMAIRCYLGDHVHTDIVAHSHDGFPVRTGEEFLEFLRAVGAAGKGQTEALGKFLAEHTRAKGFVEAPKPIPSSFARESYFAVTAFRFTDGQGASAIVLEASDASC